MQLWLRPLSAILVLFVAIYLSSRKGDTEQQPQRRPGQVDFPPPPFTLRSSRVVLPDTRVTAADIHIDASGTIAAVVAPPANHAATNHATNRYPPLVDVGDLLVMPGLVDPHVHANSPGRTEWEGFASAARAAAAGGTTAILDMPLNSVPSTVSMAALALKARALATAAPDIDVGIIAGVIPANLGELSAMYHAGVLAFKSFMVDSQSPDFPHVTLADLSSAMQTLASLAKSSSPSEPNSFPPYILHAELPPETHDASVPYPGPKHSYPAYLASRPDVWETDAVSHALRLSEESGCRVHIAHVASADAAELVGAHRAASAEASARVTAETCPQYLLWSAEDIPDARPEYKCAPPIRSAANRERLWLHTGAPADRGSGLPAAVEMVVSDHSPTEPTLKKIEEGDVRAAWGGIAGLQYRLQATWTASLLMGSGNGATAITRVSELLSSAPARVFGLGRVKGSIAAGRHADFVIWDPDAHTIVRKEHCMHRHKVSPFIGMNLTGVVHWTLLRGRVVYSGAEPTAPVDADKSSTSGGRVLVRETTSLQGASDGKGGSEGPRILSQMPSEFADGLSEFSSSAD